MAIYVDNYPATGEVYCASQPIVYQLRSDEASNTGFRFKARVSRVGDPSYLIDLTCPPNDNDTGILDVSQVAKDTLYWDPANLTQEWGTVATHGDVFSVICSARWLDSSGTQQGQTFTTTFYFHAILCDPPNGAVASVSFDSFNQQVATWQRFVPLRNNIWKALTSSAVTWNRVNHNLVQWPTAPREVELKVPDLGYASGGQHQKNRNCYYHRIAPDTMMTVTRQNSVDLNSQNAYLSCLLYDDAGQTLDTLFMGPSTALGISNGGGVSAGDKPFYNVGVGPAQLITEGGTFANNVALARWYSFAFHSAAPMTSVNQIGPTYFIQIDDDACFYSYDLTVMYADRGGSWNTLYFSGDRRMRTRIAKQTTYRPLAGNYTDAGSSTDFGVTSVDRGTRIIDTTYSRSITLTSRYVEDDEQWLFEDLMTAPLIYLVGRDPKDFSTPVKLLCTTKSLNRFEKNQDGLIRVTMDFEIAEKQQG